MSPFRRSLAIHSFRQYIGIMKQTVTIETENAAILQLLRNLAAMSLVKFVSETPSQDDLLLARLNEVYSREDSSLDPSLMMAQIEAIGEENW